MNRLITLLTVATLSVSAYAYDHKLAQNANKYYSHLTQEAFAKSKLKIAPEEVMKMLREKKDFTILDVRTAGEMAVLGLKTPNTLEIPINVLFQEDNLNKIPTDKPVLIVCHSGARALLASVELKKLGFKNIRMVTGGFAALAVADNVKNAPIK